MATHNVGLSNSQVDNYLRANYPMRTNDSLDSSQLVFVTSSGLPKRIPYGDFVGILSGSIPIQREGVSPAYSQTVPAGAKSVIINSVGGKTDLLTGTSLSSIDSRGRNGALLGQITIPSDLRSYYGMLYSVTDATYDEYDFRHKKLIKRTGYAYFRNLDFSWNSGGQYFEATFANKAPGWNNVQCAIYSRPATNADSDFVDRTIKGFPTNDKIALKDSRYSTVDELIAAIGTYYVFASPNYPREVDISAYLPAVNILPAEEGGHIIFKQLGDEQRLLPNDIVFSSLPAPE